MEGCKKKDESIPDAPETGDQKREPNGSIKQAVLTTVIISSLSALFITTKKMIDGKNPHTKQ